MKLINLDKESIKLAQEALKRANQSSRESMQALNESMRASMEPAYESMQALNESMRASMEPALKSAQALAESMRAGMEPALESAQALAESMRASMEPALKSAQALAESMRIIMKPARESMLAITQIIHKQFEELVKKQPGIKKREEEMLRLLGESGWYIDSEMKTTFLPKLAEMFSRGNVSKAEKILINYYKSRLNRIVGELCQRHPNRRIIIEKAFSAHQKGNYEISIPLFFTQTDGICFDLVNENFFRKDQKSRKPILSTLLNELSQNLFLGSIYYPLITDLPISKSKKQRYVGWNKLNRHQIIHGEVTDYGTESNSLKAISLLNYVSWILDSDEVKKTIAES